MNGKKRMAVFKQSTKPDTLDMYVYGEVMDTLAGDLVESETSAKYVRDELAKYPNLKQINIYINSVGGDVMEGTAIHSQLKRHPAKKTVYIDGFACSIAAVIAMCGDKVVMPSNTMMMIHNVWMVAIGNATEIRKAADDLDVICESNRKAFLEKSNGKITEAKLKKLLEAETWLTAEECVKYGFCDEIAGAKQDLSQQKQQLKSFFGGKSANRKKTNSTRDQMLTALLSVTPSAILASAIEKQNR